MSQQTAVAEQEAAAARKALPLPARRKAARVMYRESVSAGMPMTPGEVAEAFGMSVRWGRERVAEIGADLAELAEPAVLADRAESVTSENARTAENSQEEVVNTEEDQREALAPVPTAVDAGPSGKPKRSAVLTQHLRIRWGVRATLALGVIASTVANVLHAHDNPISQTIAAWPPLALLATIELISRVPVFTRWLAGVRFTATALIAGIAAWVSYWHMADVISRYGEIGASPYLIPLTVDGLVVVASVCLVELGSRIRALSAEVAK